MSFDDFLSDDAAIFTDPEFMPCVERVEFHPHGGAMREIDAQVFRDTLDQASDMGGAALTLRVFIRYHATLGATSVDPGGDRIKVARRLGATPELLSVIQVLSSDAGGFTLLLA